MNRSLHTLRAVFSAFLLMAPSLAGAVNVDILPGDVIVKGVLEKEARFHLLAIQNVLQQPKHATFVKDGSKMETLRDRTIKSTVARVEYTYGKGNKRIYHVKSGRSIEGTLNDIAKRPGGNNGNGSSSSESDGSRSRDIDVDVSEQASYTEPRANEVRVPNMKEVPGGVKASDPMRIRDAELKAMRALEADMNSATVLPGGDLEIFVSQAPCHSCTEAITKAANTYKLRRTVVHHLTNRDGTPRAQWSESQKASSEFFNSRTIETNRALATGKIRPVNANAGDEALDIFERAEAAESGRLRAKATCGP